MSSLFGELGAGLREANEYLAKYMLGFAVGTAAAPALAPFAQTLANDAWKQNRTVPPLVYILAEGVAQRQVDPNSAREWAHQQGFSDTAFSALVDISNSGPGVTRALELWRRGEIDYAGFVRAIGRDGIEDEWLAGLAALKQQPLEPSTIATAVHRGIMRDPSLIVREPPTAAGKVEQVPASPLDPVTEASWSGIDHERLRIEVGTTGLPPGLIQMLQLLNRGEVTEDDVRRAVSQSNLRNEYMDVVLNLRRHLLTPHEYEEAALRGIIGRPEADRGAAMSGMEQADAQLLFEILGRPLTVHQLVTALARGGVYGGTYADVPEPYRDAIRRSNIRPEYARLAYANRYSYNFPLWWRALVSSGALTPAEAEQILLELGNRPDLAKKVTAHFAGGTGSAGGTQTKAELLDEYAGGYVSETELRDVLTTLGYTGAALDREVHLADARRLRSLREKVVKVIGDAYLKHGIDATAATSELAEVNVVGSAATMLISLWDKERRFTVRELTARQVARAVKKGLMSHDAGLAELTDRGYSQADAETELAL